MQSIVFPGLQLTYHFGYTRAVYTTGKLSSNGDAVSLNGKYQVFTPDITSMFAAEYKRTITASLSGFVRMEWFYFGRQYFDLLNTQKQSSYQLLNFSAGLSYKLVSASLWFRNITDTKYIAYAYDFGAARLGDPGTVGVTVRVRVF
jgi:iron complex outermembrane recepter protein